MYNSVGHFTENDIYISKNLLYVLADIFYKAFNEL